MSYATNHSDTSSDFKYRLVFTVVLLNLLVYSLAGFSLYQSNITYEKQAAKTTQNIASILEQNIRGEIDKIDISLIAAKKEIERQMVHGGIEKENINKYMEALHSYLPSISALRMADSKGDLVYGTGLNPGISVNIADRDYFIFGQDSAHNGIFLSKPILGRVTKRWVVNVSRRVNAPDGSFAGIVFGSLTLEHFNSLFSGIDVGKKGSLTLRDNDLVLIVRYPEIDNTIGSKAVSGKFSDMYGAGNKSATYLGIAGIDKTEGMISYRKVSDYPLVIVAALASNDYLAEWRKEVKSQIGFAAFFTLVTLISSWLLSIRWRREKAIESELRKSKDGLELRVEQRTNDLNLSNQKLVVELSERKQAEEALREEQSRAESYLATVETMIVALDADGKIATINRKGYQILGYGEDELLGKFWFDTCLPQPEGTEQVYPFFIKLMAGELEGAEYQENPVVTRSGALRQIAWHNSLLRDKQGHIVGTLSAGEDITERKLAEDLLIQLKDSVENSTDAIGMATPEGKHFYENKAFTNMFGEFGENPTDLFVDEEIAHEMFRDVMAGGHWSGEVKMYGKDKRVFDILLRAYANKNSLGRIVGLVGIHTDITERKRAEEDRSQLEKQLLHAQKLESLGVLAGGIAHDFNNILMAIIGNADLALMRINKESPATDNLHRIEQAAARAADLAKQMLAYSGKGKFVIDTIDLNYLLEDMLHMLEVSISKKAVLRINPHHPLPQIEADATQIRQIIMNLVINASEAIGDKSGVIAVTTGCMDCDKNYLKDMWLEENLTDGLYVYLEIADTGCGMDKATLAKIFDPFFTTKFTGRGLGMAAVLGIVRGHKGAIKVYSEPKKGTTFKLLFPASNRPVEIFNHVSHSDDWRGSGTVLLVDDEETIRGVGKEMLQEFGFTVITADDGREAVEIFKTRPDITMVILDLTMPHMDGEECFRELRKLNPNIKVIMSSGFNEQEVTQKFVGKGLAGFIQKPYRLSVLREVIQKI